VVVTIVEIGPFENREIRKNFEQELIRELESGLIEFAALQVQIA